MCIRIYTNLAIVTRACHLFYYTKIYFIYPTIILQIFFYATFIIIIYVIKSFNFTSACLSYVIPMTSVRTYTNKYKKTKSVICNHCCPFFLLYIGCPHYKKETNPHTKEEMLLT